ncbi:hypothetical protein CCH79_00016098 [Gambusia affinis]|uniref:RING-type domain-containing protein n=1 Tax=Gambusia affinis TaxID=33528 RepID=A0A315VLJ7_GAMAF|nr:hypothetical protein CCH79_00016098 [Gambusia affinis]
MPVVIGALGAVTPKLEQWLQQIPGTTSDISVQKCAVLCSSAQPRYCAEPSNSQASGRGLNSEEEREKITRCEKDMAAAGLCEDQPLCCICLDVFTQPVALPCQHHFCWTCITKYWDNTGRWQCPLCNRRFTSRPELQVNTGMSELSDQLELLAQQTACCSLEPLPDAGQVVCSVCTKKAQMSCLVCLSSYCETHQVFHERIPGLRRHTQLDPVDGQEDRMWHNGSPSASHISYNARNFKNVDKTFCSACCVNKTTETCPACVSEASMRCFPAEAESIQLFSVGESENEVREKDMESTLPLNSAPSGHQILVLLLVRLPPSLINPVPSDPFNDLSRDIDKLRYSKEKGTIYLSCAHVRPGDAILKPDAGRSPAGEADSCWRESRLMQYTTSGRKDRISG